jgi:opacity protein-like surface antigen
MKKVFSILLFCLPFLVLSQTGGQHVYQFLDLDFNSRSMALGGDFVLVNDNDINLAVANPAIITENLDNKLSLNHAIYPSGINYGQIVFGKNTEKFGTFTTHMRYVSYGEFKRTDELGVEQGTFSAGDYAVGLGYGYKLNEFFSIGANFNTIFSHFESYSSIGASIDVSTMFFDPKSNITAVLIARNLGYQFKGYTKGNHEPLPLELLAGISYKFHHAPLRLSLMAHDLNDLDMSYNIPGAVETYDPLTGDTIPVFKASFVEKLFRHLNFGVEIQPTDNFSIRLGYNYNNRKNLAIEGRKGISGFSGGVGFKIKRFEFDYALAVYSSAGASNMFTITTNLSEWYRKE